MSKERNDFSGPIGDRVPWEEFSTEFLSKIATLWREQWEAFTDGLVRVGSQMEGVGQLNAEELLAKVKEEVSPPTFAKMAEVSKQAKSDRLKIMRQWQEKWEAFTNGVVRIGSQMEGVGLLNAAELLAKTMGEINPPIFAKIAEVSRVDVNTAGHK